MFGLKRRKIISLLIIDAKCTGCGTCIDRCHQADDKKDSGIMYFNNKIPVNTLLSRKRYAVLHLRKRLTRLYEELLDSK